MNLDDVRDGKVMDIYQEALRLQHTMSVFQGMNHALGMNSSK
jgi:hypothetical protein